MLCPLLCLGWRSATWPGMGLTWSGGGLYLR